MVKYKNKQGDNMSLHVVKSKVASLKEKGLVENKDFRVVYFEDEAEIKITNFIKLVPNMR